MPLPAHMASQTNEEIIENLTKDLADTNVSHNEDSSASDDSSSPNQNTTSEINDDPEIIDENNLQERDSVLSNEDKEVSSLICNYRLPYSNW